MNIVDIAISIAKATGIDRVIGRLFSSKGAERVATTVAAIAMQSDKVQSDAFKLAIIDSIIELEMMAKLTDVKCGY